MAPRLLAEPARRVVYGAVHRRAAKYTDMGDLLALDPPMRCWTTLRLPRSRRVTLASIDLPPPCTGALGDIARAVAARESRRILL
jgi:hypothetical protein